MTHIENKLAAVLLMLCLLIARAASGQETVIHSFATNVDVGYPTQTLLMDARGNLYGTADYGPVYSDGTVFELSPIAGGGWTQKVIRNFNDSPGSSDGASPASPLISDGHGNLYGTTAYGGSHPAHGGTVFELSPSANGTWTETVLYSFGASPTDGFGPTGNLVFGADGNLYGTTFSSGGYVGGSYTGTAFELTHVADGWTEKILH